MQVDIDLKKLAQQYKAMLSPKLPEHYQITASGYMKTDVLPVLFSHENQLRIEPMNWSLAPSWAKEYPPKWSSYNARMERTNKGRKEYIYDTPTFRDAFTKNKFCLVPIKSALEACYWGETAGKIISFGKQDHSSYLVAGLYDSWVDPKSGAVKNTCTLITDNPYPYLFEHGHDRSLILLDPQDHQEFLTSKKRRPEDSFQFIRQHRIDQDWSYQVERDISEASIKKNTPTPAELEQIKHTVWSA